MTADSEHLPRWLLGADVPDVHRRGLGVGMSASSPTPKLQRTWNGPARSPVSCRGWVRTGATPAHGPGWDAGPCRHSESWSFGIRDLVNRFEDPAPPLTSTAELLLELLSSRAKTGSWGRGRSVGQGWQRGGRQARAAGRGSRHRRRTLSRQLPVLRRRGQVRTPVPVRELRQVSVAVRAVDRRLLLGPRFPQ
jgi:hypothetical protein